MEERAKASVRLRAFVPDVLRTEPQFRLLFAGQVLSLVGDRVMLVALPFAVLESGGGLGAVGLVVTAQLVPFLVFALIGGVLSDRGDRKRVVIASDVARLVAQAIGGGLLVAGAADPWSLGLLAAVYGSAEAFFQPAFTGLLPQTVSHPGQLQPANAVRGLSFSISSIAGPALAGVLVGGIGAGAAMLFDAGSFAVSVACLVRLRPRVAEQGTEETPPPFVAAIRAGWREVRSRSRVACARCSSWPASASRRSSRSGRSVCRSTSPETRSPASAPSTISRARFLTLRSSPCRRSGRCHGAQALCKW